MKKIAAHAKLKAGSLAGALLLSALAFMTFPLTTSAVLLAAAAFALGLGLGCGQPLLQVSPRCEKLWVVLAVCSRQGELGDRERQPRHGVLPRRGTGPIGHICSVSIGRCTDK